MSNRLAGESSPYLQQHADNPVDWYPWGSEALQRAREEDKPIFLSVGYAACHWCHVMEHESFENPDTAAIMNEHFINIKVDREERPDIDSLYMDAVVLLAGQGGWPMSVFLTPDGKPFYGGTYYPPEPRHQLPSFRQVLISVSRAWNNDRERLMTNADTLSNRIASIALLQPGEDALDEDAMQVAAETLFRLYDWTHGGWGGAPKFPMPQVVQFLLRTHHRRGDALARDMATHALANMARGGIRDHLAGGFHRYAVDQAWLVPHFEKMLYDNALLSQAYLDTWKVTGDAQTLEVAEETLRFLLVDMRHPEGGFYSSLDADSEGEEGLYYVWTLDELRSVLTDDAQFALFVAAYGATEAGNFEGKNILYRAKTAEELAEAFELETEEIQKLLSTSRTTLLQARAQRQLPALDDKVVASWNGFVLHALAEGARALDDPAFLKAAQQLAGFFLDCMIVDGKLMRSWRLGQARQPAFLEDHAALGMGLLALYQADFNPLWYQAAIDQADEILTHFRDPQGGFFDTRDDHETLIARPKSMQDSPTPSGNTLATELLFRLSALSAEAAIRAMQDTASRHPTSFAGWLSALDFAIGPQWQLAMVGRPESDDFRSMAAVIRKRFLPNLVIAGGTGTMEDEPPLMRGRQTIENKATAYLCQSFTCNLPTTSPDDLLEQLEVAA
jgi:hypothetical protein